MSKLTPEVRDRLGGPTTVEVEIQGVWFDLHLVADILEALEDTGLMNRILIESTSLAMALEDEEVIQSSNQGSYYRGHDESKFDAFRAKIIELAQALSPAAKMSLGSATVPEIPPAEIVTIPITRLARFNSITRNSSINSILSGSQTCRKISQASREQLTLGR